MQKNQWFSFSRVSKSCKVVLLIFLTLNSLSVKINKKKTRKEIVVSNDDRAWLVNSWVNAVSVT